MAHVGVRLSKVPLHVRFYQQVHIPGAPKPSVAAALVSLAEIHDKTSVLDPCCGSATILIEAAVKGARASGGDHDPQAIAAAQANVAAAQVSVALSQWDATSLPLPSSSWERVITNLPWGRQVRVDMAMPVLHQRVFDDMRRVLAPHGRVVLLTHAPEWIDPLDLSYVERRDISLYGQHPSIVVFLAP